MLILGLAVGLFINLERQDQGNVLSNEQWKDKSTKLYRPIMPIILNMRMYRRQYLQKPEHIKSQLEKRDSTKKDNKQIQWGAVGGV